MALEELKSGQLVPRKYMAHYIDATPNAESSTWVRLGRDLEEYKEEYNTKVESKENIIGEMSVNVKGYEVSSDADPYYAIVGEPLYEFLENIARKRLVLDGCKTKVLTVLLWKGTAGAYEADCESAVIEIKSRGGGTDGVAIPFAVHNLGDVTSGTFNESTKTFTATQAAA